VSSHLGQPPRPYRIADRPDDRLIPLYLIVAGVDTVGRVLILAGSHPSPSG
jgi:hypothetical protein